MPRLPSWTAIRTPSLPPPQLFVWLQVMEGFFAVRTVEMALAGRPDRTAVLLGWLGLTTLGFGIAFAALPLIATLKRRGWMARSGLSSWFQFYGVFFATGLAGGAVRSLAAWQLVPIVLTTNTPFNFALNIALMNLFNAAILESLGTHRQRWFERHAKRRKLAESLGAARAQVVSTEDRVRKELAEILHGKIQSHLMGAWTRLEHVKRSLDVDRGAAARALQEAIAHLNAIHREGMVQVHDLLAAPRLSFREELLGLITRYQDLMALELVVEPGALEALPGSPPLAVTTLRMLDEALLNALRHARATRIRVVVRTEEGGLLLRVEDDGVGFERSGITPGLGMAGLRHGFERLGGACEVQSGRGRGTTVTLRVPRQAKATSS